MVAGCGGLMSMSMGFWLNGCVGTMVGFIRDINSYAQVQ